MIEPLWKQHPLSRQRAEEMGLTEDPRCGACAEYIYCGACFNVHDEHCTVLTADERAAHRVVFT